MWQRIDPEVLPCPYLYEADIPSGCYSTEKGDNGMKQFAEGDRVRIDIPDEQDPDHDTYHGQHGVVVDVLPDDADAVTGEERDAVIYQVKLESGEQADFRWRDLRPPIADS